MASYSQFIPVRKKNEGGYVSAATAASIGDRGGETYAGIARNFFPDLELWKIVDAAKAAHGGTLPYNYIINDPKLNALVDAFFKSEFWDYFKADSIKNQSIANLIVDWGLNSGKVTVAKKIQRLVGVLDDGKIGSVTLGAVNGANQQNLFNDIKEARRSFVEQITSLTEKAKQSVIANRVDSFFFHVTQS